MTLKLSAKAHNTSCFSEEGREANVEAVPRTIYMNNRSERSVGALRTKLMRNTFFHQEFDSFIQSRRGKKYYQGVLPPYQEAQRTLDPSAVELDSTLDALDIMVPHHQAYQTVTTCKKKRPSTMLERF